MRIYSTSQDMAINFILYKMLKYTIIWMFKRMSLQPKLIFVCSILKQRRQLDFITPFLYVTYNGKCSTSHILSITSTLWNRKFSYSYLKVGKTWLRKLDFNKGNGSRARNKCPLHIPCLAITYSCFSPIPPPCPHPTFYYQCCVVSL